MEWAEYYYCALHHATLARYTTIVTGFLNIYLIKAWFWGYLLMVCALYICTIEVINYLSDCVRIYSDEL